jgi:class 3 adenylate cyclase/tetratricopeptide (TPR) repeat protein
MRCSKCGAENPDRAKFCGECASPFTLRCPSCDTENSPTAKFCIECAKPLERAGGKSQRTASASSPLLVGAGTPDASLEGERKTITVLFADIKGSMSQIEDLDPEEARAIVDPALALMAEAVSRYRGHVAQSTGDGVFALFGAPTAHEDHPQRAVYAAMRMLEELRRYSDRLRAEGKAPVEIRIGINTGEVVMRSVGKDQSHTEYLPAGHAVGLASRLQTIAPTGSVALSEQTRRLVEGYFQLKALGPTRMKGVTEAVNVYEVLGLGPSRTKLQRSASRGLTRFVGRNRELDAMKAAANRAKAGHGEILAAMAEAGVGKSRLFFEFKATSQSEWTVLEVFSVSHDKASAYLPVIDLLRNYFQIAKEDDERTRREKVTGRVIALDRSLEDTVPYLFSLLGIVEGDDPLAQMDGQIKKRRTLDAVKRILTRESLNRPLMLMFEDLHWIDEQTQELLNLLADSIGTAKFLLLVNYRPEYSHQWGSKTYYTQLRLDPLGKDSAEEMLSSLLGDGEDLLPLKRLIIERTDGTPFFMEEIVQALFEDGVLQRNGTVKLARPLNAVKVPATVQAVLAARIDRLPAEEKDLLQTLAVLGREFPLGLVHRVTLKPDDELERGLSRLQAGEFIYEQSAAGDVEYIFKHALTQEVAHNALLVERRRLLHRRTAVAIESLYRDRLEDHYADLARHYSRSDDAAKAVEYLRLAAKQAVSRSAYSEAAANLKAAFAFVGGLPEGTDRLRAELALHTTEDLVASVLHGLGSQDRERALQQVCEISERLRDTMSLLRGSIALSNLYISRGEPLRTREICMRHLGLAEQSGVAEILALAHWMIEVSTIFCGDLNETRRQFREWRVRFEATPQGTFPANLSISLPAICGLPVHLLGGISEALELCQESLGRARALNHRFTLGIVLISAGYLYQVRREPEAVREVAEAAMAIGAEQGFPEWLELGRWLYGWALAELGETEKGVAEMEVAIAGFVPIGGVPRQAFTATTLAKGYEKLGRVDQAIAILEAARVRIQRSGERLDEAELYRVKGELLVARDGVGNIDADACLRKAIEIAQRQESRWWELRASTSLARLLAKQGKRDEARTMLEEIYGWFTEGFDTADLKDAKALLVELS